MINKKKLHVLKINQAALATLGDYRLLLAAQVGRLPSTNKFSIGNISYVFCIASASAVIYIHLFPSGWLTLMAKTFADKPDLWLNICLVNHPHFFIRVFCFIFSLQLLIFSLSLDLPSKLPRFRQSALQSLVSSQFSSQTLVCTQSDN